jgi:hypothetical protein
VGAFSELAAEVIDAGFETFGKPASYQAAAGGAPVPCTVITDVRDVDAKPADGSPPAGQSTLEVRASEVLQPIVEDTFTLLPGGKVLAVMSRPLPKDPEGLVWSMWVQ